MKRRIIGIGLVVIVVAMTATVLLWPSLVPHDEPARRPGGGRTINPADVPTAEMGERERGFGETTGMVTGRVLEPVRGMNPRPAEHARVEFVPAGTKRPGAVVTVFCDPAGRFAAGGLTVGAWQVTVLTTDGRTLSRTVDLGERRDHVIDLGDLLIDALEPAPPAPAGGAPALPADARCMVSAVPGATTSAEVATDVERRFEAMLTAGGLRAPPHPRPLAHDTVAAELPALLDVPDGPPPPEWAGKLGASGVHVAVLLEARGDARRIEGVRVLVYRADINAFAARLFVSRRDDAPAPAAPAAAEARLAHDPDDDLWLDAVAREVLHALGVSHRHAARSKAAAP